MFIGIVSLFVAGVLGQPVPFSFCYGNVAYCQTDQVILQCILSTNGSNFLQPGVCYDILNNPLSGALCAQSSPDFGDAVCFANGQPPVFGTPSGGTIYQAPTPTIAVSISPPTQTPDDIPGPGDPCYGDVSFCLPPGEFNGTLSEILTCNGTNLVPHDCNDYLNYPPNGAECLYDSFIDGKAVCHAIGQPTPALTSHAGGTSIISNNGLGPTGTPTSTTTTSSAMPTSTVSLSVSTARVQTTSASTTTTGLNSSAGVARPSVSNAVKFSVRSMWNIIGMLAMFMYLLHFA